MKATKILAAAAIFSLATAGSALAFHSGGVAECEGCHSMHNSFEGSANVKGMSQYQSGPFLLKAQDQSGSCLNCHASADSVPTAGNDNGYHIATLNINPNDGSIPAECTPGGDFAWLRKTTDITIRGNRATGGNEGDRHGHNIIAVDFGYTADKTLTTAPGGTYPASALACSSCHDPHGRYRRLANGTQVAPGAGQNNAGLNLLPIFGSGSYGNGNGTQGGAAYPTAGVSAAGVYRILGGVGYQPKSLAGSFGFANPAPDAVAPSKYNHPETTNSGVSGTGNNTTQIVVAYGQGMSEWCANCHTAMLENNYTAGMPGLVHPAGNSAKLTAPIVANYNAYVSSGVFTNTGASYSSLAPFENGSNDYVALAAFVKAPTTADTSKNVLCLSCHRAHASGFESMARYFLNNEFMTVSDSAGAALYDSSTTENKINYGYTVAQQQAAYNGRPATVFGPYARNYCNKCHAKD